MVIDGLQLLWFLLFIFQIIVSIYLYSLYRKDKDKRTLIFSIGFFSVSYSHLYETLTPSFPGLTQVNFFTAMQYWSFYPLLFALAIAIHNTYFQSVKSNKIFRIYAYLLVISFPLITIHPQLTSEYIKVAGLLFSGYLIIASIVNTIRSRNSSDLIFVIALISYLTGVLGLLGYFNIELSIFSFFTGNSYLILLFFTPQSEHKKKTSYIENYLNIQKELAETRAELDEREKTFQTLFNQLADPVMILDKKGKFLELTDRVKEYTGFEKQEILGKNFLTTNLLTAKSKAICIKNLMKRMAGIHVGPYEVEAMTKDGRIIPFEVNAQKITYHGKNADLVIFRDISVRVKAQQELRESENRYRSIFNQSGDGVLIHDLEGRIIDVNNKLINMFGYSKDEFKQMNLLDAHDPSAKDIGLNAFNQLLQVGSVKYEADFKKKNAEVFTGDMSSSIITIGGQKFIQGILRDITERKEAERKLTKAHTMLQEMNATLENKVKERTQEIQQILKQKDEFIIQLGHDLKNPLGPLINLLPILEENEEDLKQKEILQVVNRNVTYMKNLVTKTIELAQLKSPNSTLHYESFQLNKEITEVLKTNKILFDEKGIIVRNNIPLDIIIEADKLKIHEVFNNLLNNSVKYNNKDQAVITIDYKKQNDDIIISIKDMGIGMTEEQIMKVFDEFYKADQSRHDFDSSGLGMPITKRIIEMHGGKIWVESDGIGKGSTFYFTLPQNMSRSDEENQ